MLTIMKVLSKLTFSLTLFFIFHIGPNVYGATESLENKIKKATLINVKHLRNSSVENQLRDESNIKRYWDIKFQIKCKTGSCAGRVNSKLMKFLHSGKPLQNAANCPVPFNTEVLFIDDKQNVHASVLIHMSGRCFKYDGEYYYSVKPLNVSESAFNF